MPSVEQQILCCAAGLIADAGRLSELRQLMTPAVDQDRLCDLAVREGLGGILYKCLLNSGLMERLGSRQRKKLQTVYYRTVGINLKLTDSLKDLLQELNRNQIPVVLLQGMALLEKVYDDPGLRPMKDVDLWVLPADMNRLAEVLDDMGYQRYPFYPRTFEKGGTVIDLRTHIFWADRIRSRARLCAKNQKEIFRDCDTVNFAGAEALCLNPADLFLYQCLHTIKHNADRLIWLADLLSLTRHWSTREWASLSQRSRELGLKHIVVYSLYLLNLIFGFDLPAEIRQSMDIRQPGHYERLLLGRRMQKGSLSTWGQMVLMSYGRGLPLRIAFILENLFPRPDILRQIYPNSPSIGIGQLYWKRLLQIIGAARA